MMLRSPVPPVRTFTVAALVLCAVLLRQASRRPPAQVLVASADQSVAREWSAALASANATLAQMTQEEKSSLLLGVGWERGELRKWWYVGNTPPVRRLGIPPLNMMDAGGGFRTYWSELIGTVTCWPSLLALASTWDAALVGEVASSIADEFVAKGANVLLGPSVNVHRVPRGGRNFEYLSGDDPYLGAKLTASYVRGVQSRGVLAVVKHFAFNQQETNRDTSESVVDDATAAQLYFPPFEAAVAAGVGGVMCSYNRVGGGFGGGAYACGSAPLLSRALKGAMHFSGPVISDWGASHATSDLSAGLDVEMPMDVDDGAAGGHWFSPEALRAAPPSSVDSAALRVLAAMDRVGLRSRDYCAAPCERELSADATSDAHTSLARRAATESIVLLRNERGALPISTDVKRITLLGTASAAQPYDPAVPGADWARGDYYSGGGSGHVSAGTRVVTPRDGIRARARASGIAVRALPTDDPAEAAEAVRAGEAASHASHLTVVVVATTSGESVDRPSLSLDNDADALVAAAAAASHGRVVVLVQARCHKPTTTTTTARRAPLPPLALAHS